MLVECYDEKGAEVYEMIIKQIFQDLVLGPAVEDLKAFANPDEAVFILAIKMKKTSGVIKFGDVANFTYDKNNKVTKIFIENENYLPNILSYCGEDIPEMNFISQPDTILILTEIRWNWKIWLLMILIQIFKEEFMMQSLEFCLKDLK